MTGRRLPRLALAGLLGVALAAVLAPPSWAVDPAGGHGSVAGRDEPAAVWRGPRDRRVVALTFDDGYAPWNVRRILRILDDEGVVATFFLNGIYLQRDPGLWRAFGRTGHAIGNHTYMHEDATRMTGDELVADLRRNERVVEAATGRSMAPVFRPPYGRRNAATDTAAARAGFPAIVMWDVSALDATRHPRAAASIRSAASGRAGSIVLLHAGPTLTPRILRSVIRSYRERGFAFVTVPDLLGLPDPRGPIGPAVVQAVPVEVPCRAGDRNLDCAESDGLAPAPPGDDQGGEASAPGTAGNATAATVRPAAASGRTPVADRPAARESAWARGPDAGTQVAVLTAGLLAALVAAGVLLGRRRPRRPADALPADVPPAELPPAEHS
jgi:peptidoglycan/xylan/chitin deacetylase (PgdA/CDA1 family)